MRAYVPCDDDDMLTTSLIAGICKSITTHHKPRTPLINIPPAHSTSQSGAGVGTGMIKARIVGVWVAAALLALLLLYLGYLRMSRLPRSRRPRRSSLPSAYKPQEQQLQPRPPSPSGGDASQAKDVSATVNARQHPSIEHGNEGMGWTPLAV